MSAARFRLMTIAWLAWMPLVLDQPHLLALWLAIGWWFLLP
jgi:hypothetical protein